MSELEDLPTIRLAAVRSPLRRGLRARVGRAVAPAIASPRITGTVLALLMLGVVLVSLLTAFGEASALRPITRPTPTPSPTARATATPTPRPTAVPTGGGNPAWTMQLRTLAEEAYVNSLISRMSLDEEIGQMMMISASGTTLDPGLTGLITQYRPGSVILYAQSITSADQIKKLTSAMQAQSPIPLLIATDVEGGGVNRLASVAGFLPSASDIGANGDPAYATQQGVIAGQDLAQYGFNVDLAPVVDVLNVPDGAGPIKGRAFGRTPQVVTTMAGAYLKGLQQGQRVIGTLKHFPGLGDVTTDPHGFITTLTRNLSDLQNIDWAPYRALIATGQVEMVMSTHVYVSAVDPTLPATLSYPVLTGVLRNQLGFKGVIITDAIYMKGLWENLGYSNFGPLYVKAVQAGNDIICSVGSFDEAQLFVQSLRDTVANDTITKQRIDESVRRILLLKLRYGVLS